MSAGIQKEPIIGRPPTVEENELLDWAEEVVQKSLTTVQDNLRQMVTLNTALLAGSAALLAQMHVARVCVGLSAVLLIISLSVALFGMFPREATVRVNSPDDIKEKRDRGIRVKMNCLKGAGFFLVTAFCVLIVGLWASS